MLIIKKTKQSLTKIENYLINHRRKLNNDLNKIKPILTNYISIYKEMYNIYFSKFLKNNDYGLMTGHLILKILEKILRK